MKHSKVILINLILFVVIMVICLVIGLFVLNELDLTASLIPTKPAIAQEEEEEEEDKIPPNIYNINITDVVATSAVITWETDEESDSLINYGLNKNYGVYREPRFDKTSHTIVLDDLQPGKTYYFRITSSDENGNQGISSDYSFVTTGEEEGPGIGAEGETGEGKVGEGQTLVEEAIEIVQKITDEQSLIVLQAQIQETAEDNVTPPTIILDMADVEVGTDYANIRWKTDKESNTMVALANENDYDIYAEDPYVWREGNPDEYILEHEVLVTGLSPATKYHFQAYSTSRVGLQGRSGDMVFTTKSILPEIYNINLSKIEEESATITWVTNVPCSSIVEYTNLDNNDTKLEGNSSFITIHNIKLSNLIYDTYYSAQIKVESEFGEKSESEAITFITTKDEYPPTITKVNTESTLYPGSENKVQTIVSWQSDEPAICQLFYHQGLVVVDEGESLAPEDEFALKHVQVVTNFLPSTVYKFWIVCEDDVGNQGRSQDFTMLTPTQEESIIDIIIKNFESTFGWVKKLKI
jgi:hypothetical protein